MRLHEFLAREKLSLAAFGKRIGVSSEAVRRYATEGRVPTPEVMRAIFKATQQEVAPNDFFGVATAEPERRAS